MKIPDVNLLVYAHDEASPFHAKSKAWLKGALQDTSDPLAIPASVALAFIRIVCNPKASVFALPVEKACEVVELWFDSGAILLETREGNFRELSRLLNLAHGGVSLIPDAHLAALAIEHNAVIYSNDRDFQRFPGLKLRNPIDS